MSEIKRNSAKVSETRPVERSDTRVIVEEAIAFAKGREISWVELERRQVKAST